MDQVETLVRERAKQLFGADHVNAQPDSGTQANVAVYMTVCKPGDTLLGMSLAHGGHLTHGHPLNFSGKMYRVVSYGVRQGDERIDYDEMARLAGEHKPRLIVCGASAYPSRVIKGKRLPGRMGGARVTVKNLNVVGVDPEQHLIWVRGSVPGPPKCTVLIRKIGAK